MEEGILRGACTRKAIYLSYFYILMAGLFFRATRLNIGSKMTQFRKEKRRPQDSPNKFSASGEISGEAWTTAEPALCRAVEAYIQNFQGQTDFCVKINNSGYENTIYYR